METADQSLTIAKVDEGAAITVTAPNATYNSASVSTGKAKVILTGKGNYFGTAEKAFTIAKAAAPSITYPTASSIRYGTKLSASSLTGGSTSYGSFEWENGNIVPTVTNSGYPVKFTPSAATLKNYEAIANLTQDVSVTVSKVTPAINLTAEVSGTTDGWQALLTASLTKAGDGELPTGTVKFVNTTTGTDADIAEAATVHIADGVATYTWTGLTEQVYKVKVIYSGSDRRKPRSQLRHTQTGPAGLCPCRHWRKNLWRQ